MKYVSFIIVCLTNVCLLSAMKSTPGFSLHNKSNKKILVQVKNNPGLMDKIKSAVMTEAIEVAVDGFYDKQIDITKPTELTLYELDTKRPYFKAQIARNKTIFINWDGQKIYPQRGPLKGLTGKTDRGYSLKNNVVVSDIVPVPLR